MIQRRNLPPRQSPLNSHSKPTLLRAFPTNKPINQSTNQLLNQLPKLISLTFDTRISALLNRGLFLRHQNESSPYFSPVPLYVPARCRRPSACHHAPQHGGLFPAHRKGHTARNLRHASQLCSSSHPFRRRKQPTPFF